MCGVRSRCRELRKPLTILLIDRDDPVVSWPITTVEIVLH